MDRIKKRVVVILIILTCLAGVLLLKGFVSNINSGVRIQKLSIENRTAKIDFDEQLEFQVGGSCRVAAIRAQITETLKQFPTIDSVTISINGRTEDILQP